MAGQKRTLRDIDVAGKRVLTRVDFNVPLADGRVLDTTRIQATLPTIRWLGDRGATVILLSHLGRPQGRPDPAMSLRPVAAALAELLGREVAFVPGPLGAGSRAAVRELATGGVAMLENVRFHPGEEANDPPLAAALAEHGEIYVNDAFGAAHRAHASTAGVAEHLPAVAGLLLERELDVLGGLLRSPRRPFAVLLGGAKVRDKFGVIAALLARCDLLLLGGAMANTFLAAAGAQLGGSRGEPDLVADAGRLLALADRRGVEVLLPVDRVVAPGPAAAAAAQVVAATEVPPGLEAFDIGPATVELFGDRLQGAATVFWNGPMGMYEEPAFAKGTAELAAAIAAATDRGAVSVAAGGDSLAVVAAAGLKTRFSHLSTGGGAALELLEGKVLPGVAGLGDRGE